MDQNFADSVSTVGHISLLHNETKKRRYNTSPTSAEIKKAGSYTSSSLYIDGDESGTSVASHIVFSEINILLQSGHLPRLQ
jgi:hypothetical protein